MTTEAPLPAALRTPGWMEPGRVIQLTLVASSITLLVASWGLSLPTSAFMIAASRSYGGNPDRARPMWLVLASVPIYAFWAAVEGMLLKTHDVRGGWTIIQNAHAVFVLAGVPGTSLAVLCALALFVARRIQRDRSFDGAERVLLSCGVALAVGGTVAAFLHLTFRSIPATLFDVVIGVVLLAVGVRRDLGRIRWIKALYAAGAVGTDGLHVSNDDARRDKDLRSLPALTRGRGALHLDRVVVASAARSGDYRSAATDKAIATCPATAELATSPPLARIAVAIAALAFVAIVFGAVIAEPREMLRFLR